MTRSQIPLLLCGFTLIAACSEEPRPRSVTEFLDNPIVLEAAVVRCSHNRDETRYDVECVNVRQAISIIEAKSERDRLRREAEYVAQFGELPAPEEETAGEVSSGNAPTMVIPEPVAEDPDYSEVVDAPPASDGGNAPMIEAEPESDLDAIREELQKRNEESGTPE
jgi:hypothetical protein